MFTSHNKDNREKDKKVSRSGLGRRDLMRLGARAAVAGMLKAPAAFARQGQQLPPFSPTSADSDEGDRGSGRMVISIPGSM